MTIGSWAHSLRLNFDVSNINDLLPGALVTIDYGALIGDLLVNKTMWVEHPVLGLLITKNIPLDTVLTYCGTECCVVLVSASGDNTSDIFGVNQFSSPSKIPVGLYIVPLIWCHDLLA